MFDFDIIWLTGQAGSGKTEIAKKIHEEMANSVSPSKPIILDGDEIRLLFQNRDYSVEGRERNVTFVQNLCDLLIKNKIIPIVCMVSPFEEQRTDFLEKYNSLQVYVHTSDIRGRENYHVEYYEKPIKEDFNTIFIDTSNRSVEDSFLILKNKLKP